MKINLDKVDWVKTCIYFTTVLFLTYLFFICFIVKPNQILFGNVFIKPDSIDFGGFGSLLAGIFSPLAFLWLVLNFRQQNRNLAIAEDNLLVTKNSYESQKAHQLSEYLIQITSTYIDALKNCLLNFRVNGQPYELGEKFIKEIYAAYERGSLLNPNEEPSNIMYSHLILNGINFEEEVKILRAIENQILEEKDESKRRNLITLLQININPDILIILRYSFVGSDKAFISMGYKNYVDYLFTNKLLNFTTLFADVTTRINNAKKKLKESSEPSTKKAV